MRRSPWLKMGSCVSVQKDPEAAMRLRLTWGSKVKKLFIASPSSGKIQFGAFDIKGNPVGFGLGFESPEFGSKEEIFFDTQPWLESDCEDDFVSVNGEFTPSQCSTPKFYLSSPLTPQLNNPLFVDEDLNFKSGPLPRRKLADLFQETPPFEKVIDGPDAAKEKVEINGKSGISESNTGHSDRRPESSDGTSYVSGTISAHSRESTPTRDPKSRKAWKAVHCCLPQLVHTINFDERGKKMDP